MQNDFVAKFWYLEDIAGSGGGLDHLGGGINTLWSGSYATSREGGEDSYKVEALMVKKSACKRLKQLIFDSMSIFLSQFIFDKIRSRLFNFLFFFQFYFDIGF